MSSSSNHHPHNKGNNNGMKHNLNKKRLTQDQVRLLEANFTSNKKLEPERKLQLARQLGVPPRQIAIWYQNKKARWKNQSLELDYSALQLRLETALDEKTQLEREVAQLQAELQRTREILMGVSTQQGLVVQQLQQDQQVPPFSSFSGGGCGGDEGGGSTGSLHEDSWQNGGGHHHHHNQHQGLQFEELCAWLMGSEQGATNSTRASIGQHEKVFLV
ncbi:OLC1v1023139C1 [Oldenlandia corymbosa var. corymbosa]|uniref:Homeobox-leucine zipper protein n=1 Tax=Oldenlandia corymbosa var. corymbosa TaxID=529605 RepID=A0AAV1BZA0_OLDCO|nr:OLC1v1023139C1 [Oldenlandia corymbosa var. corymbosa]